MGILGKTEIAFRKLIKREKLSTEEELALENRFKENSEAGKIVMRIVKHPITWLALIPGGGSVWYFDLLSSDIITRILFLLGAD